jgi:ribosomal protein S18 acetylase RimI-like enzyme
MMTTNGKPPNRQPGDVQCSVPPVLRVTLSPVAEWTIAGLARLSGAERLLIDRLRRACEAAAPLDLKIELDEADHLDRPIHFLATAGDEVIGYAGVTAGDEAEACGMVHPSWRRRGVGSALLGDLCAAATSVGRDSILVICEDAGPAALAWMTRLGAVIESAERRMVLRPVDVPVTADAPIEIRPATGADHDAVVAILGGEFDDGPGAERLVGVEDDSVLGTLRLTESSRRTMIYGFVVDATQRGRRLGTRMLAAVLARLRDRGIGEVGLEVDPENGPALRLYERFGFKTVTTYRHMRLAVTRPGLPGPGRVPERREGVRSPGA